MTHGKIYQVKPLKLSLFLVLFSCIQGFAALEPSLNSAIPFYKDIGSLFPSGQAKKSELLESTQSSQTDFQFRISYENNNYYVKHNSLIREIELVKWGKPRSKLALSLLAELGSSKMGWVEKKERVEILSQRGAWARVKTEKNQIGYLLISDLEPYESDTKVYKNLSLTPVYKNASDKSPILFQILPFTKLELIEVTNGFGKFKTETRTGFIPMSQVIGRSDFADRGWNHQLKKWQEISYRNGSKLIVKGQIDRFDLMNFTAFRGKKNAAIVSQAGLHVNLGARVQIEEALAHKWNESYVKGHGLIWWKTDLKNTPKSLKTITTAELLKKNLTGISYDSKQKKGLASASGIYQTRDGKNWSKLDFFGNQDWPVLIHSSGVWFVGSYKSSDEGESFQPFLKWSEIVKKMQSKQPRRNVPYLKVVGLQTVNSQWMKIKIDTGSKLAAIQADPISSEWSLIP